MHRVSIALTKALVLALMLGGAATVVSAQEKTAKATATHGLRNDEVLDDAKGLSAIHGVRANGQECGGAYGAIGLGDEEKAGP